MRARWAATAILLFALAPPAAASTVWETAVDRDTLSVGDPVALLLRITAGPGKEAEAPEFPDGRIGPFEILEGPVTTGTERSGGGRVVDVRYVITAFETGELVIPALEPPGGGTASRAIPVTVRSVGLDPAGKPRDVKPPREIPRDLLPLILGGAALLLLLAGAAVLYRRWKTRADQPAPELGAVDLRPAHVAARERLGRLAGELEREETDLRLFHYSLSETVRRYLSDRYALPAPERTSREILREYRREKPAPEATALLRECLRACDRVKFAGRDTSREEAAEALGKARAFVETTRESGEEAGKR